jgi:hypothetical protein
VRYRNITLYKNKAVSLLVESSPETYEGSFSRDLIYSKFWMCSVIKSISKNRIKKFDTIYALGSWFGNIYFILKEYDICFKSLYLIDKNPKCIDFCKKMFSSLDKSVLSRLQDANSIEYVTGANNLVINTSCNDMGLQTGWYNFIPSGYLVALQSRNDFESFETFNSKYQMKSVFFAGKKHLSDPETNYCRLMKVGAK